MKKASVFSKVNLLNKHVDDKLVEAAGVPEQDLKRFITGGGASSAIRDFLERHHVRIDETDMGNGDKAEIAIHKANIWE